MKKHTEPDVTAIQRTAEVLDAKAVSTPVVRWRAGIADQAAKS